MSDIFISYAKANRSHAQWLAKALQEDDFEVWWDMESEHSSESANQERQQALSQAKCVIVLWSNASATSEWVEAEAHWAWERSQLYSVSLDNALPLPAPFDTIDSVSLASWDGNTDFREFQRLRADILAGIGRPEPVLEPPATARQETTSQPVEPNSTSHTPIEPGRGLERGVAPGSDAAEVPVSPPVKQSLIAIAISAFAAVVVTAASIALAVYLETGRSQPEPRASSLTKVPFERRQSAPRKTEGIAPSRHQPQESAQGHLDLPEMVVIPSGQFKMGCASGKACQDEELPSRTVIFDKPFAIGRYEVTFAEYDRFAQATKASKPRDEGWGRGSHPIINVSWNDAVQYANWLSQQTGKRFRLPTEAEWEYAARGGKSTPFSTGECIDTDQANYDGNEGWEACPKTGVFRGHSVEAGTLPANPLGLYEVHGNVWEWVQDCRHDSYRGAPTDGSAWKEADRGDCRRRIMRGGSWYTNPGNLRSANRFSMPADRRFDNLGFRLAQDLDE